MAKQRIEKSSRKERRAGDQHRGWNYDGQKGKSWNARSTDESGNQVGKYNPSERLFGPQGGGGEGSPDRPADMGSNLGAAAAQRGGVAPGVRDQMQRDYTDWYHSTSYTGRSDVTKDTSDQQWHKGLKGLL